MVQFFFNRYQSIFYFFNKYSIIYEKINLPSIFCFFKPLKKFQFDFVYHKFCDC